MSRPRNTTVRRASPLAACTLLLLAGTPLAAAPKRTPAAPATSASAAPDPAEAIDSKPFADDLVILSDGAGHHLALVPFGPSEHVFYGDGVSFHQQRVGSSSSVGREQFSFTFWEPRVKERYKAALEFKEGRYLLRCGDRETTMLALPDDVRDGLLAKANFSKPLWKHEAYALARDDRGIYYYIDHLREPADNLVFRIYRGPRGQLKQLAMINVVSDSAGEIFSTRSGELRLIVDKKETVWLRGKRRTPLTALPLYENAALIYRDLGAYVGQRLGTPCDDL